MSAMTIFWIVLGSVLGFLLIFGYASYHAMFLRAGNPRAPHPGKRKRTVAKQLFADNYAHAIEYLEQWGYETVSILNFQGKHLIGYYFKAKHPTDTIALCFHGFRNTAFNEFLYHTRMYLEHFGFDVLIVDNKAHGASDGTRIGFSWNDRRDCIQWCHWIADNMGPDKKVLLQGISMGAATVLSAAGEPYCPSNVRWIVSDCSFSTLKEELLHVMHKSVWLPTFPFYYILSLYCRIFNGFWVKVVDVRRQVSNIKVPVLFIHGGADKFVPTRMAFSLYEACNSPKDIIIVDGAQHGQSYLLGSVKYIAGIEELVEK